MDFKLQISKNRKFKKKMKWKFKVVVVIYRGFEIMLLDSYI